MRLAFFLFLLLPAQFIYAQQRFSNPVDATYMADYIIVNYVDWDTTGIRDHMCGTKTYDGHQGTDFVLRSFSQMDSGVYVLAVDSGVVFFALDTLFDRNKAGNNGGLGNYIGISHSGKLQTYYGHLKKNSLLVGVGDTVFPGQRLAQIGSSGNSTDPHLHFELWYDSTYVIDPYSGPCGNSTTFWLNPLPYDTGFGILRNGLTNFAPSLDTLREYLPDITTFNVFDTACFWIQEYGVRKGDTSMLQWFDPDGVLYHSFSYPHLQDWWYYYFWGYTVLSAKPGTWKVLYSINGNKIQSRTYEVEKSSSITERTASGQLNIAYALNQLQLSFLDTHPGLTLHLFNVDGKLLKTQTIPVSEEHLSISAALAPGVYFVVLTGENYNCRRKVLIY